jgi:hypothetical protein
MPNPSTPEPRAKLAAAHALLLSFGLAACGGGGESAQAEAAAQAAADAGEPDVDGPQRPAVDPCALLTPGEVSAQLFYTIPGYNRDRLAPDSFEVKPAEVEWGISRRCEFSWQTRSPAGETPLARGLFIVMVFPVGMVAINESERRPVSGGGADTFRHQQVYYVTKGELAVSLTDFGGTQEEGRDENTGRVALLQGIASRLP